jgi:LmbE family N-acetylglucosaminyl deacetylase
MKGARLLAVLAHPDDESFGLGGTLALYARRGAEVDLVCATQGEAGTVEPDRMKGYTSIAELRRAELDCAAEALGLASVHYLGYRDSGMQGSADNDHPDSLTRAPLDDAIRRIVEWIRRLRPQVIITFDPVGVYHHPDHILTYRATLEAFLAAADPLRFPDAGPVYQPEKLYLHTISRRFLRWGVRVLRVLGRDPTRFGVNQDIDLTELAKDEFPIHARIDIRPVQQVKEQAGACHASQSGPAGRSRVVSALIRFFDRSESFMRAYPPAGPGMLEHDLFAGIEIKPI